VILTVEMCGEGTNYEWYRNGSSLGVYTSNVFLIENYTDALAGIYSCVATHPSVPGLELERYPITVETYQAPLLEIDRYALEILYVATAGDTWINSWGLDGDLSTLDGDPTTWYGVTISKSGRVTKLNLAANNLFGMLPDEIGWLTGLVELNLSANFLGITLTNEIQNLTNLKELNISRNVFEGLIPDGINSLTKLTRLDFSSNSFSGTLPYMGDLIELNYLNMSNNKLEALPASLFDLYKIRDIYLNNNYLTGSIPSTIANLLYLTNLYLNNNQLSGSIPIELFSSYNLLDVNLANNAFEGAIPYTIGNMKQLKFLNLSFNKLNGDFPSQISDLYEARTINLRNNQLTGSIPTAMGYLWLLEKLDIRNNKMTGEITLASQIDMIRASKLKELYLSGNQFIGALPANFYMLEPLEVLDLKNNMLEDVAGLRDLSSFKYMSELTLEGNKLQFDDLQPIPTVKMTYIPQQNVQTAQTLTIQDKQQMTLTAEVDGTGNIYQWYKGGQKIGTASTSNTYTITAATVADEGVYYCEVTNDAIPGLVIKREPLTLQFVLGGPVAVYPADLIALHALYVTTTGSNWKNNDNWLDESVSVDTWYGVTLSDAPMITENGVDYYRVVSINLSNNSLNGTLPGEIENLTELKDLNLYINRISGDLLSGLGKLTNLTTLNLGGNLLSGTVPVDFKYLTKLTELNLTSNFLEGTFPAMLLEMPTLQSINLSFNGFDGTFSLLTTNLPALTYLNISDNKFSGTFPSEINNLSTLKKLEIQNNVFFGDFPAINGLQSVEYVDISFNDFSSFPSLAMLPYIQTLTVKNNRLEFDDLEPNVSIVNFSYSPQQMVYSPQEVIVYEGLSYTIKSEVGGADNNYYWYKNGMEVPGANQPSYTITGATQFESGEYRCFILSNIVQGLMLERYTVGVTVSKDSLALVALYNATKGIAWAKNNNWLTQNIDTWYGVTVERGKVTKVNLNSNNLDGTLPYEIGYLTNLNTLNLYENNLSGTLPIAIGWLQNLEILNVRNNSLSGTLPDDLYNLGKITSLNLSKNQFEGAISSNIVLLNSAIVLDFSNNNFLNMNEITLTPSNSLPNLQLLSVANNYLTFGDLEYNMNKFSGFSYVPQKMVDEQQTITASEFSSISLSVYVDGSKNMYTWSKGNSVIGTPSTDNSLVFSKVQLADAGSYHCTITNSLVPDLFLTYAPIKLEVTPTQLPMQSHDQDILLKLYYSADGANWNYMWNPAQVDVYNWHGVTLNHEGYVTHIDLTGNNLVGTIAPELSQLQYLESFVVADNVLSGELPISIGSMPKLRTLDISNNKLNVIGQLPASLTLDRLKVSSNYLNYNSLEINASIPNIEYYPQKTLVETIMIQGGQSLTITFDAGGYNTFYEWKKGTNSLYDFDNVLIINDADLTNEGQYTCVAKNGLVMQSGFKLEKIFNIDVIEAPVKEADKAALIALYNATNGANWNMNWNLSEDVRTWYGVVVDIKGQVVEINLSGNNLSGQLPAELGNLTMLTSLNLGNNNITGSVPNELASLSNLQTLILKNNLITSLPDIRFVKLNQLDVSSNDLAFNSLATHIGIENFLYVPQNLHIYTFSIQGGDNLTLNVPGFQAYNYYEWYQNDNYLFNEESKYDIIDAKQEDNGIFSCVVTNTFVPTLELEYRFIVQVTQRDIVIDDYNALIALYNATNGQNWIYTWDLSRPVKEWKGVELDYSGKVTKIDLSNNMLKGYLPTEIGNLSRLHCLRLSNNLIGGTIPNSIGNLIQLDTLMLNKNMLSGAIPDEINNLEFLYVLYLNNNELTTLPATISGLYNLEKLYLNNNRFETSIPPSYFDYLDWIKVIQLANNKFFGELPQFATLYGSALEELYVQNNNFGLNTMVRTIPNSIFDLWNLKIFSAYNNSLSGEISSDIVNMHNLRELRLSNNKFTGNLPQNMDNLRDLEILELNQNLLNGVIPMSVGLMSNVRILDLSDNNFSGDMPDLVNLTSVEEIVLNNNNLTGIPPFSLDYLSKLDIQNNFMEFDDIEKLSSVFNVDFTYTPQGDINNAYTETVDNNTSFLIETIAHSLYPLNYQWHRNDQPVGTNSPIYSVEFALAEHQGVYTCVVTSVNSDMKLVLNRSDVTINVNIIPIPINDADYNALLKLYAATNGAGWTNKLGWENPSKDSKDWYGVTFDKGRVIAIELSANKLTGNLPPEIGDFTALQKLVLSNNQIEGSLPAEIGKLSTLQILDLSWNAFQNQIPAEIGNMSSLTVLNLANNRFAGTLTAEIGKITTLKFIDLNSNQLNGEIPAEIGSLLALTNLNLSYNDLSGSVPSSMANLVHLVNLEMIDNQLSGEFPKIDNLKKLLIMNIESNDFEGLPNLSMLLIQKLTVKNNRLTFEDLEPNIKIPTLDYTPQHSIGLPKSIVVNYGANWELKTVVGGKSNVYNWKLNTTDIAGAVASNYIITKADDTDEGTYVCLITNPLLPLLILHTEPIDITVSRDSIALAALYRHTNGNSWTNNSNWLTGNLDTWYGLNVIDHRVVSVKLPSNNLVGVIPDSIGYLEEVEEINLLGNSLNNSIPASIGELKKLNILNLRNNKLSGELPDNIFNLASLTSLNLSNNLLSGTIKKELSNLKNAIVLDLSYNYFRDLDVLDVSKLTKLQLLSVSYNKLTFEDIVPNQQNLAGFNFNPQRKFNLELVLLKNKGESYILQIDSVGGNNLVYQWYKDGKLFGDVQSVYSFEVNNLSVTHEGDYTCRVYWKNATNDVVYDFFIERSIIRLNVQRELPMPIVKVNNPYCFGDKQVTLSVTQTEDDNGIDIIWYRDKELTDSISSGFTFLYTMPAEIDTIYALRADGIKKGESAEVIIKLRPDIIRADNKLIATFVEGATYTWYYNNARLDITVNSIDLNGNYGNYRVSLVNGGCTSSSPEYIVTVGGISTAVAENLQRVDMVKVYPNPAQNVVNVQFTDFTNQSVSIEIMDISGKQLQRVISNTENTSIDISSLARGVYFLRIATEGKLQTYKLIKVD